MAGSTGYIRAIAFRPAPRAAMVETHTCHVTAGGGIDGENRSLTKRGLTLLSAQSWADACREIGALLPWHTRRANLLIEGFDLASAIGSILRVGEVELEILGETKPCGLMDELYPGLRAALVPACRGGIYGQVRNSGHIRVGDPVARPDAR